MSPPQDTFGILAEFKTADELVEAAARVHREGYRDVEAYSPLPVEGLAEAVGFHRTGMPLIVLIGGIVGFIAGYALQYYGTLIWYPNLNIGGRPLHSWPAYIPVIFEMTVLFAVLSAVLGMLALNGLPRPHHPLFSIPEFDRATQDRFFLCVLSRDNLFDPTRTRQLLQQLGPMEVIDVPE